MEEKITGKPHTFLVRFIPHDHRTFRVAQLGREVEHAVRFAKDIQSRGAKKVSLLMLDGFSGEIIVEDLP